MRAAALGADCRVLLGADHRAAVVAVPDGDPVAPPQLAGDAPVLYVLHPVEVNFSKPFGNEARLFVQNGVYRGAGKRLHLYEPLLGYHGLYSRVAAVAVPHAVGVRLYLYEIAELFELFHNCLAALITVHAAVFAGKLVHGAVLVHHLYDGQLMAKTHLEVVGVVRGRDLNAARAVLHVGMLVGDHGYGLVYYGQNYVFADIFLISLVIRVYGHGCIAEHGLGTGGGNYQSLRVRTLEEVFQMPEMRIFVHILHLGVGESRPAFGAPVDYPVAVVYKALIVEVDEHLAHGARAFFVHGEGKARPVAGGAELFKLCDYPAAVLLLPVPREL